MSSAYRILIAESEAIDAAYLRYMLEKEGWQTEIVTDGEEVLQRIRRQKYFMVMLCGKLSGMEGVEVALRVRELEKQLEYHPFLVGLCNSTVQEERRRFMSAGTDYCLHKPVYRQALFEIIQYIERHQGQQQALAG